MTPPGLSSLFFAVMIVLAGAYNQPASTKQTPNDFVEEAQNEVLRLLQDARTHADEPISKALFSGYLIKYFDTERAARFVLGPYWKTLTTEEQVRFSALFKEHLGSIHMPRFAAFAELKETAEKHQIVVTVENGEEIVIDKNTSLVRSTIKAAGYPSFKIDWRVIRTGGSFKIVDVLTEGVSVLQIIRDDLQASISRNGVRGLLNALEKKYTQKPAS